MTKFKVKVAVHLRSPIPAKIIAASLLISRCAEAARILAGSSHDRLMDGGFAGTASMIDRYTFPKSWYEGLVARAQGNVDTAQHAFEELDAWSKPTSRNGWIFVVHAHGSPFHNLILDQACDYFRDTYGGRMVHLRGLEPTPEQLAKLKLTPPNLNLSEAENRESGSFDVHAGFDETSRLMFLRPDLVNPTYHTLQPLTANNPAELFQAGKSSNWQGYIGSPRLATANYGAQLEQYRAARDSAIAFAILSGFLDEREIPRYSNIMLADKTVAKELEGASRNDAEIERKQRAWMKKKGVQ